MNLHRRLLIGIFFAFVIAAMSLIIPRAQAEASALKQEPTPTASMPCQTCHPDVQKAWFEGAHSSERTSHVLNEEAYKCEACHPNLAGQMPSVNSAPTAESNIPQGPDSCVLCHTTGYDPNTGVSKSYGVTCEACHSPAPANHPSEKMPVDSSADLCGKCHSDSRFNWTEWQDSKHYQKEMQCVECHDPHSASLQKVEGDANGDKSALCANCHEEMKKFSYSVHSEAGVSCVNCHLGEKKGVDAFHIVPNHSFVVEKTACNKCHADELHNPRGVDAAITPTPSPAPDLTATATPQPVPAASSSGDNQWLWLALVGIAGLMGLVIGVVIPNLLKTIQRPAAKKRA